MSKFPSIRTLIPSTVLLLAGFSIGVIALIGSPGEKASATTDPVEYLPAKQSAEEILIRVLSEAKSEVLIQANTLKSQKVVELLRDKSREGVKIEFIFAESEHPNPKDPRYLVGWILANKIGGVSLSPNSIKQACLAVDQKVIIAFSGQIDSNVPTPVLYVPVNSKIYPDLKQGISDIYSASSRVSY